MPAGALSTQERRGKEEKGEGGGTNKVKTKELQFGSRRRVQEGDMSPLHEVQKKKKSKRYKRAN